MLYPSVLRNQYALPALAITALLFFYISTQSLSRHSPAQAPSGPSPLRGKKFRIVPIGDSITEGYGSSDGNGYRQYLLQSLAKVDSTVEYVGTLTTGSMANNNHEGYGGFNINQIAVMPGLNESLAQKPNVVLLHAGTNDINTAFPLDPYKESPERLGVLIDKIMAACPTTTLIVAKIIQGWGVFKGFKGRTKDYNDGVAIEVAKRADRGVRVMTVDMSEIGLDGNLLDDGLHPDDKGYLYMADLWLKALVEAGEKGWVSPLD